MLNDSEIEIVAARFKILGESSRMKILRALFAGERCVSEIIEETGLMQANVSKQLRILTEDNILECRADGLRRIYKVIDPTVKEICKILCEANIHNVLNNKEL